MKTRLLLALALTLALAGVASAGPILAGTVNGVLFCATDNNTVCNQGIQLPDLDPAAGSLQLGNVTLGGVTVNSSTHTQVAGPTQDILNSQSLQVINNTGGTITAEISVGGVDFVGPIETISTTGSGLWQNAVGSFGTMTWYADMFNAQGGETFNDHPGILLATFFDAATLAVDSFSVNGGPFPFVDGNLFSMTTNFQMSLVAGGQLNNRGQAMIADITAVPEPASMMLLGTGLLAALRARRKLVR